MEIKIFQNYGAHLKKNHFLDYTGKYGSEKTTRTIKDANFRTNSFVLAHSSAKKIYNEQLTLKSSIQWYHMTECDVI